MDQIKANIISMEFSRRGKKEIFFKGPCGWFCFRDHGNDVTKVLYCDIDDTVDNFVRRANLVIYHLRITRTGISGWTFVHNKKIIMRVSWASVTEFQSRLPKYL